MHNRHSVANSDVEVPATAAPPVENQQPILSQDPPRSAEQQYRYLKRVAHNRPAPSAGTPVLIWRIGVWPKSQNDPQQTSFDALYQKEIVDGEVDLRNEREVYNKADSDYGTKALSLIRRVNQFLLNLQKTGRTGVNREVFLLSGLSEDYAKWQQDSPDNPIVAKPGETVAFTLWWSRENSLIDVPGKPGWRTPPTDAVRVRVQVERTEDYAAFTFLIDVDDLWITQGSSWKDSWATLKSTGSVTGGLRSLIFSSVTDINNICGPRLGVSDSDDSFPQAILSKYICPQKTLQAASDTLYDGVWRLFEQDFTCGIKEFCQLGEIFVNVRGLIFSTRFGDYSAAIDPNSSVDRLERVPREVAETIRVARYRKDLYETAGVLMAYWPFVRAMSHQADYREYVGFSVLQRRGIYITSLGAESELDMGDEGELGGGLEQIADDPPYTPIRYLFMMQGIPQNRRSLTQQIGRLIQRANNLATYRHFILKDIREIRDASKHIRMRGQQLDALTKLWSDKRLELSHAYTSADVGTQTGAQMSVRDNKYNETLARLAEAIEGRLMLISAELNQLGKGAIGGLHFRINRARHYMTLFRALVPSLRARRIEGWMSYQEFVDRRLSAELDFVDGVGHRLQSLRGRLQDALLGVQTSAIVRLSRVTAANTDVLRKLQVTTAELQNLTAEYTRQVAKSAAQSSQLQRSTDQLALVGVTLAVLTFAAQANLTVVPEFMDLSKQISGWLKLTENGVSSELARLAVGIIVSTFVALSIFSIGKLIYRISHYATRDDT